MQRREITKMKTTVAEIEQKSNIDSTSQNKLQEIQEYKCSTNAPIYI